MICSYIRSSSYNNYDYCQMQYFMTYVLGFQSQSGKKADLGTIVHKVMETLANLKKLSQDNPKEKKISFIDDAIGEVTTTVTALYKKPIVPLILEKSFNFYTNRSPHNSFTSSDRNTCLDMCWSALQFNNGQFDPRNRNIVQAEPHFDIPIEEDWATYEYKIDGKVIKGQLAIKGTIDLVTEIDKDTVEVIDWKTGRRLDWASGEEKTYAKLNSDPQLLLYNYAISKLFPNYKQSIMSIFFIKDGGPFSICFDSVDQQLFLKMLKNRFKEICANNAPRPISEDRSNWKCTKLCHFCKNKWPDTNQSMCVYIDSYIKKNGIEKTIQDCKRADFDIGFYEAPG
jgi:ATP-dependent helicase/DNAse subunit B